MSNTFHIWRSGKSIGPYSTEDMKGMLKQGRVERGNLICPEGSKVWVPLSDYLHVFDPPPPPVDIVYGANFDPDAEDKKEEKEPVHPINAAGGKMLNAALILFVIGAFFGFIGSMQYGAFGFGVGAGGLWGLAFILWIVGMCLS